MDLTAKEEAEKFLNDPEINIWIDKYDDVFAEYDSRPFAQRALSDDFLKGVRKMISEKPIGAIELKFNVLGDERNPDSEVVIINKLNQHFKNIAQLLKEEEKQTLHKGYMLMLAGFALMIFLVFLGNLAAKAAYISGISSMLEPVGWFMTWTGLDNVFQNSRKNKSALDFHSRMAYAEITFSTLETETPELDANNIASRQKVAIPVDNNNLRVA